MVHSKWLYWALIPTLLCLSACKDIPSNDTASRDAAVGNSIEDQLAQVRAEIIARNFGRAAELGRATVTSFPKDPGASFELARAEALAGNQGYAIDALEQAVTKGLGNASAALKDPAFQSIRSTDRFRALEDKANPSSGSKHPPERARPTVSAGRGSSGVEIYDGNGSTRIRAGDVVLETDF